MTDCAKYLNGRGVGARYDGSIRSGAPRYGSCVGKTGKGSTFSQGYKDFLRKAWEAQVRHKSIGFLIVAYHDMGRDVNYDFYRLLRLRKRVAGYSGLGKPNRQTNGHILPAYGSVGFRKTQPTTNTPTSVVDICIVPSLVVSYEPNILDLLYMNRYHVVHTC